MRVNRYRIRYHAGTGIWLVCRDRGADQFWNPFMAGVNLGRLLDKLCAKIKRANETGASYGRDA